MDRTTALDRLRSHRSELEALGIKRLSLFGSVAREEAGPKSDVDLAAEFDHARATIGLLELARIENRLSDLLQTKVDLLSEPVTRNAEIQRVIDKDRVRVF